MKTKDKPNMDKEKNKIIILWEVNSFPFIISSSSLEQNEFDATSRWIEFQKTRLLTSNTNKI